MLWENGGEPPDRSREIGLGWKGSEFCDFCRLPAVAFDFNRMPGILRPFGQRMSQRREQCVLPANRLGGKSGEERRGFSFFKAHADGLSACLVVVRAKVNLKVQRQ